MIGLQPTEVLSQEIDELLQSLTTAEEGIGNLPNASLESMLQGLKLILDNLELHKIEADRLRAASKTIPSDRDIERILLQLEERIRFLILRTKEGTAMVQNAMDAQRNRRQEIDNYQIHLNQIEDWLRSITHQFENVQTPDNESDLTTHLQTNAQFVKTIHQKIGALEDLLEKTKELEKHEDVKELAKTLADQLTKTILLLREYIITITVRIEIIERRIIELRQLQDQEPVSEASLTERTIDSGPMPEEEPVQDIVNQYTVETQTSESMLLPPKKSSVVEMDAQTSFPLETSPPANIETLDISVQTSQEQKPTENISVVQKIDGDQETIQIDTVLNKNTLDRPGDVLVEARYNQPSQGEVIRKTELILKNVPQSFETTFVEPDETTTEVVVDPDGTKRIVLRKIIRTRQQVVHQSQQQHITSVTTSTGDDRVPVTQSVQHIKLENQQVATTTGGDGGTKTVVTQQAKGSIASGQTPDTMSIHEFENEPQTQEYVAIVGEQPSQMQSIPASGEYHTDIGFESSIRAVVQQVTRKVIRKTRKIIKRVVIIDGKEHVTEEVVEEPEDVEITEESLPPHVNVNIIRTVNGKQVTEEEFNRLSQQDPQIHTTIEEVESIISKPSTITTQETIKDIPVVDESEVEEVTPTAAVIEEIVEVTNVQHQPAPDQEPGKFEESKVPEVVEEETAQVFEYEKAPVALTVDKAPVEVSESPTPSDHPHVTAVEIENIDEIWPVEHHLDSTSIEFSEAKITEPEIIPELAIPPAGKVAYKDIEEIEEIWPKSEETGSPVDLATYTFEPKPKEMLEILAEDATPAEITFDVRSATQMFIDNEANTQPTKKIISVTAPTKSKNGESSLKISMDFEPSKQSKVQVNIIELVAQGEEPHKTAEPASLVLTETEHEETTSRSDMETDPKRNRKRKKRKEKKISEPSEDDAIKSVDEKEITPEEPVAIVETPIQPVYPPAETTTTLDETEKDKKDKKSKRKQNKEKVMTKYDEDSHIPVSSEDHDSTDFSLGSDAGKIHIERIDELSPESTYSSMKDEPTVKVVEEAVISPDSASPRPIAAELVIPKDVLEIKLMDDAEQQTSPRPDERVPTTERPVPQTEPKSMQTSPEHKQEIATISLQTSVEEQPEVREEESQTVIVDYSETEVQTTPREEILSTPVIESVKEVVTEEVQTDTIHRPVVEQGIQEKPDTEDISSQTVIVTTVEQELQTSPRLDEAPANTEIPIKDIVAPVVDDIIREAIGGIEEDIENKLKIDSEVQTSPRADQLDESSLSSATEPYDIEIEATLTIPQDNAEGGEPFVYEFSKTIEMPVEEDEKKSKKKSKKSKKGPEVNVSVEFDQKVMSQMKDATKSFLEGELYTVPKKEVTSEPAIVPQGESHFEAEVQKPNIVQLSITKTTVYDTFQTPKRDEPQITEPQEKSTISSKQQRPRPTSSVMIEEVMSPTDVVGDTPLTPGPEREEPYTPENIWKTNLTHKPIDPSQSLIMAETMQHYPGPSQLVSPQEEIIWTQTADIISERIRHLKDVQKPTHLSNVLHIATLGEHITEEPVENRIQSLNATQHDLATAVQRRDIVIIQTTVVTIIEQVSTWLETIEYRVYLIRQQSSDGPSDEKVSEYSQLNDEINTIKQNINVLETNIEKARDVTSDENKQQMEKCIDTLKEQLKAIDDVTKESEAQDKHDLQRWNEYLILIQKITIFINDLQERYDVIVSQETTIENKLANLDELEAQNHEELDKLSKLMSTTRGFMRDFPGKKVPDDIYLAHDNCKNLENNIMLERERLIQLQYLAEEYEQTLNEFANITLIADRLVESPINANSIEQLHEEMQKHRKFFVNLSHCRAILESLEDNIDQETKEKHADLHKDLYNRATVMLEKAAERAQRLALAASRWAVLEKGMKDERQWLQVAQQRVPDLSAVTSADYDRYTTLYQSLSSDIAHHHAKMLQLASMSNKLQELVNAPNLIEENNEALIFLLKQREEVALYLRRLLVFRETWTRYETMTDRLECWVREAERELAQIKVPQDLREQPIEHMRQFWEVKAQFEVHNGIRTDAGNNFEKALQIIPLADEMLQRQFHAQLEDRWNGVSNKIEDIQSAIINSISSQDVPVDEKLRLLERELEEIQLTITSVKGVIKNEEELNLYIERIQVLNDRIGIIGNELGRIGLEPASQPEKIGQLFGLSHQISTFIAEELEGATLLKDRLTAIQDGIANLRKTQNDMSVGLDECEASEKMGSDAIEKALMDCQAISENLIGQWQDIMHLRQLLHTLPMRLRISVSPVKLERDISQLQDDHAVLESRCGNIMGMLRNRLGLWKRFERQLELVQESVQETDFMMELLQVHGQVDYERLRKATERLEGLSGDLENRESLLEELRSSSKPLVETCDGQVVERIEAAVHEAVTAWNETCDNLHALCSKYQRAVQLWERYREASAAVKHWADQQMETLDTLKQPIDARHEVQVCEGSLVAHNKCLSDLKEIVTQIASDVGLDASNLLQGEIDALGRRLQEVRESITTLANVADTRAKEQDECNENVTQARAYLSNVQQDIRRQPNTDAESENQLVALRQHLLTLTKTEEQLKNLQDKNSSSEMTETSITEVLELWQKIFRETFQEYHRLSTRLLRSQDSTAALKLWRQYLQHVQSFLSSAIPDDYSSLNEHRQLCEVHQNLLTSQQSVLALHIEPTADRQTDATVVEQFKVLSNLHNETLSRIMQRNSEINDRLTAWNTYRVDQTALLDWIKEREKERSRLQLRYIHIRRVPKLLLRIESLLDLIPYGETMAKQLHDQQNSLLRFCDDALGTSIRMEHASTNQRINNLRAALETWQKFLLRILQLSQTYETDVKVMQAQFQDVQKLIEDVNKNMPTNINAVEEKLSTLRSERVKIASVITQLENLNVIQEELKECISPHDMKSIRQMVWILWQQQADLDLQLSALINSIEERLSLNAIFTSRYEKITKWMEEIEAKINRETDITLLRDPEEMVKRLEQDIQSEMLLREKEREWLLSTGRELLSCYDDRTINAETIRQDIQYQIDSLIDRWERLKYLCRQRSNKIHDMKSTIMKLEERIALIRQWLFEMEFELSRPLTFESAEPNVIDAKLKDCDKIQRSIEKESSEVGEVLNLCEMLLNDEDFWKAHFNTTTIKAATENLEKRWKNVCSISANRKKRILSVWALLQDIYKLTAEHSEWLSRQESDLQTLEKDLDKLSKDQIQQRIKDVEKKIQEIESRDSTFDILNQSYAKLAMTNCLDAENIHKLILPAKETIARWKKLIPRAYNIIDSLNKDMKTYREFVNNHGKAVVGLTQIDAELTQLQHLSSPAHDPKDQMKKVERLEKELKNVEEVLRKADQLGSEVKQKSQKENLQDIQNMIIEYHTLWKDIQTRIVIIKKEIFLRLTRPREADESVQVQTLKFETDSAVQVDTLRKLPRMTSITAKDAYLMELGTAIQECRDNLTQLQKTVTDKTKRPGPQTIAKLMASCQSSVELMKHLSTILVTECSCTNQEAQVETVTELSLLFDTLQSQWKSRQLHDQDARSCVSASYNFACPHEAGRLTCPLCTQRNWAQIDNDLWRLEQWLQFAEGTQKSQGSPPSNIELLEDVVQDHREFLLDLESHKSVIASLNVVGDHLAMHTLDTDKAKELRDRLESDNERWNRVCINATKWQSLLQTALMGNTEFHQIIDELVAWLQETERTIKSSEPVDLTEERAVLEAKFKKFKELRAELERCEPRVISLQDAADQLLKATDESESSASTYTRTLSRLSDLRLRLQSLRRLSGIYIVKLGAVLGYDGDNLGVSLHMLSSELLEQSETRIQSSASTHSTDNANGEIAGDEQINTTVLARGYRFLGRVARASLPIQALLLLLLGVATLVPHGEDYSCLFSNTFARSLEPMLSYPNGPPPT